MKPIFANTFNISANKNQSEVTLNFYHVYAEHKFMVEGAKLTDVSGQVCDDVSSVMMTREGAIAVSRMLNKMIADWDEAK